jgi:hypothetical protein
MARRLSQNKRKKSTGPNLTHAKPNFEKVDESSTDIESPHQAVLTNTAGVVIHTSDTCVIHEEEPILTTEIKIVDTKTSYVSTISSDSKPLTKTMLLSIIIVLLATTIYYRNQAQSLQTRLQLNTSRNSVPSTSLVCRWFCM